MTKNKTEKQGKNGKKLFQKGGAPGPGRGKKKPLKPITLEEIEQRLQSDLAHKDPKIRHAATKLLLVLKKTKLDDGPEELTMLDPRLQKVFGVLMGGLLDDLYLTEVLDE
jgi:hypothetical protein